MEALADRICTYRTIASAWLQEKVAIARIIRIRMRREMAVAKLKRRRARSRGRWFRC